jgi:glutamate dehydrogenase
MPLDIAGLVEHATAWLLCNNRLDLGHDIERLKPSIRQLAGLLPTLLPATDRAIAEERARRLVAAGVPQRLAAAIGGTPFLAAALEIVDLAERASQPLERAAHTYYETGAHFALGEMRAAARRLPSETAWQRQAVDTVVDELFTLQVEIASHALQVAAEAPNPLAAWAKERAAALASAEAIAAELRAGAAPDLAMLVVVVRQLHQALGLFQRMRWTRGKRIATPDLWRFERCTLSKAISRTRPGATSRTGPNRFTVLSRTHLSSRRNSSSVKPE